MGLHEKSNNTPLSKADIHGKRHRSPSPVPDRERPKTSYVVDSPPSQAVEKTSKRHKKANSTPNVMEALLGEFGDLNQQFRLSNAIELQRSNPTQPAAVPSTPPTHGVHESSRLTALHNALSPRSVRCHEAIEILASKDTKNFDASELAVICSIFQDDPNSASTYISMSKVLPDEVRLSWLQNKLHDRATFEAPSVSARFRAIEGYPGQFSPPTSLGGGLASFDSDVFGTDAKTKTTTNGYGYM